MDVTGYESYPFKVERTWSTLRTAKDGYVSANWHDSWIEAYETGLEQALRTNKFPFDILEVSVVVNKNTGRSVNKPSIDRTYRIYRGGKAEIFEDGDWPLDPL